MNRIAAIFLPLFLAATMDASAQEWAKKMFKTTNHNFGTVARGSKQQFAFQFTNVYKEDIHVAGTRSSCGCATVKVKKDLLETYETGEIVAVLNTGSFLGAKNSTITVIIDRPYYAEVQLAVSSYIRADVVFTPGVVDFGSIEAGESADTAVQVAYAGRDDWEIIDVRSANEFFEVELREDYRGGGRVTYTMPVRLKPGAPVGYIQDQLAIITNDSGARTVSLPVEGRVVSPLSVSPSSLFLGVLKPGEKAKKRLVVRANKPFRILAVRCNDESFSFDVPTGPSKTMHFIPLEYTAGGEAGKIVDKIEIETDLASGLSAECTATATVSP